MDIVNGHDDREGEQSVLVIDKRGQRPKASRREGESLPISELGSKAIYQVYAARFIAVTPSK